MCDNHDNANNPANVSCFKLGERTGERFDFGIETGDDYWLKGEIVGDGEVLFNGRIFTTRQGYPHGTIIDNFPRGPLPDGWTKKMGEGNSGWGLWFDDTKLFEYRIDEDGCCFVNSKIFNNLGSTVAVVDNGRLSVLDESFVGTVDGQSLNQKI